ncbi:MAG: hypothetical protein BWX99_00815 [Deltaproteobacteria bacterium ADurb.Bin151]|nr:MAG: hypothetical protein BWX99_00815 [Deltaproteobacteria bacterium ADurb.Bin151]
MRLKKYYSMIFYISCLALAIFKVWLISSDEIIAFNYPHDELWYIKTSLESWFSSTYSDMSYINLPVYAMWIDFVRLTGVPLRIATEVLYIMSAFYFVSVLEKVKLPRHVCFFSFALIILHPFTFYLFKRSCAETFYTPILLLALSSLIMLWIRRGSTKKNFINAILCGTYLGLLWNTRKESPLILVILLVHFLLLFIMFRREHRDNGYIFRQLATLAILPAAVVAMFAFSLDIIHYYKFGLFVPTELSAPGYVAANRALLRINPPESIRFVPVTKDTRKLAYRVSPSFKELEPFLENDFQLFIDNTTRESGTENEIGAGWFYWALRSSIVKAGHGSSALEINAFCQRIADEINAAINKGKLPGRFVFSSFLDPNIRNYLPNLPNSSLRIWRSFVEFAEVHRETDSPDTAPEVRNIYNNAANRRAALIGDKYSIINGWVFHKYEKICDIIVSDSKGHILSERPSFAPRPDVVSHFKNEGVLNIPINCGYLFRVHQSPLVLSASVIFITEKGQRLAFSYDDFINRRSLQNIVYAIDSASTMGPKDNLFNIREKIRYSYQIVVRYMSLITILSVSIIVMFNRLNTNNILYIAITIFLSALIPRVALFTLLDASSWTFNPRYVFSVMPIYPIILLLIIYQAFYLIMLRFRSGGTTKLERTPE